MGLRCFCFFALPKCALANVLASGLQKPADSSDMIRCSACNDWVACESCFTEVLSVADHGPDHIFTTVGTNSLGRNWDSRECADGLSRVCVHICVNFSGWCARMRAYMCMWILSLLLREVGSPTNAPICVSAQPSTRAHHHRSISILCVAKAGQLVDRKTLLQLRLFLSPRFVWVLLSRISPRLRTVYVYQCPLSKSPLALNDNTFWCRMSDASLNLLTV